MTTVAISKDDELFRLRVEEIVYNVLRNRDLTVAEVVRIKEAIQSSIELILNKHGEELTETMKDEIKEKLKSCLGTCTSMQNGLISERLSAFKQAELMELVRSCISDAFKDHELKLAGQREEARKDEATNNYKVFGVITAITGIFFTGLSLLLKLLGVF